MTEIEKFGECLDDIGCNEAEKSGIMRCRCCDDLNGTIRLLRKRRQVILDEIHEEEKQISCLDYLVFMLEKELDERR